jgi:hypothetical protein
MTKKRVSLLQQFAMLLLLVASIFTSVGQLNKGESFCVGFPCVSGADCGSGCFCNKAIKLCHSSILLTSFAGSIVRTTR